MLTILLEGSLYEDLNLAINIQPNDLCRVPVARRGSVRAHTSAMLPSMGNGVPEENDKGVSDGTPEPPSDDDCEGDLADDQFTGFFNQEQGRVVRPAVSARRAMAFTERMDLSGDDPVASQCSSSREEDDTGGIPKLVDADPNAHAVQDRRPTLAPPSRSPARCSRPTAIVRLGEADSVPSTGTTRPLTPEQMYLILDALEKVLTGIYGYQVLEAMARQDESQDGGVVKTGVKLHIFNFFHLAEGLRLLAEEEQDAFQSVQDRVDELRGKRCVVFLQGLLRSVNTSSLKPDAAVYEVLLDGTLTPG